MDYEFDESSIKHQLKQDEFIIWRGKPDKGLNFHFIDLILSVFGIFILGFAIALWRTSYLLDFSDMIYLGLAVLLTCLGLYFLFVRYFVEMMKRSKIYYVLTNQRLFITFGSSVHVVENHNVKNASIKYHKNNHVSVYFDAHMQKQRREAGLSFDCLSLLNIANGQHVIDLMKSDNPVESLRQIPETQANEYRLQDEEVILWQGAPAEGNLIQSNDLLLSLIGIVIMIVCSFMAISNLGLDGIIESLPITIIPFIPVIFGCYLLYVRFIVEAIRRKKLTYILTNKRLLIRYKDKEKTYFKKDLYGINVKYYKNGNATIQIKETKDFRINQIYIEGYISGLSSVDIVLLNIENPEHLLSLMEQMEE